MSAQNRVKRRTVADIRARKGGEKIVCLTAYTAPMAQWADDASDLLMVGDSLGMVLYGFDSTLSVTLDMMIAHGAAVVRSSERALVVVDMPFGSYQESPEQAFRNAARIIKETGCAAVKLEGGADMAPTIAFLARRGIPVMAHIGLMPQAVNSAGGYRVAGKDDAAVAQLHEDARAVDAAGAFAVVIEGTIAAVAAELTRVMAAPSIGIGASVACDGQILVSEDMLGLANGHKAKFVKPYADFAPQARAAIAAYADEVKNKKFPAEDHIYSGDKPRVAATQSHIKSSKKSA
jgi:3-methyl-2-oxobutanoate hydroxymethyltransferase